MPDKISAITVLEGSTINHHESVTLEYDNAA